jgi:hypothetical protein
MDKQTDKQTDKLSLSIASLFKGLHENDGQAHPGLFLRGREHLYPLKKTLPRENFRGGSISTRTGRADAMT